ncbi:MAG: metallophosphoesterase, partial [Desulfarculaceae bacterium]
HPRLESITLTTSKLPAAKNSLRLVFIADLHLGLTSRLSYVKKVAALIQQARPHLILAGGDIVDGQGPVADQAAEILAGLKAPLGKFAVMGNHEAYVGLAYSQKFLNKCGFKVLRDQAQNVGGVLTLVGVDDRREGNPRQSELNLLKSVSSDRYTIFIRHRPWVSPGSLGHFDLQLSGHTHGGQIFPWSLAVKSFYSRYKGLYGLKDGAWLYVNRGSGTWGPPMRILTPPEVTLIELVSPKSRPLTAGTEAAKQAATE